MRLRRGTAVGRYVLAAMVCAAGWLAPAAPAHADSAALSILTSTGISDPVAGVPRVFRLSGSTAASTTVWVKYHAVNGQPCAATVNSDPGIKLPNTYDREFYDVRVNGPFDLRKEITWGSTGAGKWLFCIWLASSPTEKVTPYAQEITIRPPAGTITTTFAPAVLRDGELFALRFAGSSEVPAELYAKGRPAGGAPCAQTYLADEGRSVLYGVDLTGGEFAYETRAFVSPAGDYVLCLWLARSSGDVSPIVGPLSEPFTIAPALPPCIVPKVPRGTRATAMKRRLLASHCTPGAIRYVASRRVTRRAVVRLSPRPGSRLAPNARVTIYVSLGRPSRGR